MADLSQADFQRIFKVFKVECDEHIQALNRGLIALEENPDQTDLIEGIFREAHSLKGAARMLHLSGIERIAHALETMLGRVKNREMSLSTEISDLTLKGLDAVEAILETIDEGGSEDGLALSDLFEALERGANPTQKPAKPKGKKRAPKPAASLKAESRLFAEETRDAHQKLVANLGKLRKKPGDLKVITSAHEQCYALKGSARIAKRILMGDLAACMENLFKATLDRKAGISEEGAAYLNTASDWIAHFIEEAASKKDEEKPAEFDTVCAAIDAQVVSLLAIEAETGTQQQQSASVPSKKVAKKIKNPLSKPAASTVRVSSEKLDSLMGQAGELLVLKLKARQRLTDTQAIINDYNSLNREIKHKLLALAKAERHEREPGDSKNRTTNPLTHISGRYSGISDCLELLQKSLFDDFRQFSTIIEKLQDDVRKTRLFPFQNVLDVFPRMVRDLAASEKKKVKLVTSGGTIELDKYILEEIKDPLMHIIRNSIDHGIESPEVRAKIKKPGTGQIQIDVFQKGNNAVIKVKDDGQGIDLVQIKASAIKKGIYSEAEMNLMKDKQILNLIFHPGFSTRAMITDISGRGVGMDVVKANIEKLNGTIDIETLPSKGTTFTMTIPLTLSTTQSLKIMVSNAPFFLPVNKVERIIKVVESELPVVEGYPAVHYSGSYIPYVHMSEILEMPNGNSGTTSDLKKPVAVLKTGKTLAAFAMDDFLGEEEILMKGLGNYMRRVRNISGVTIMRDGTIAPVINVTDMINTVLLRGISPSKIQVEKRAEKPAKCILVVDDSVMTRTLAKNILESYGFCVLTAVDGQDALLKLQERVVDLIVSDIQMPKMDGLAFTRHVKQDDDLKHIPVVLVTALESEEDKKEGIEVGADAYIMKSAFDQSNLVSTIKSLL